ncbi:hypothetical protein QUF76_14085 [Desulfobacterales bacterium HSG16]|nr:hypothetical protein [Desulfobacterales bacterium HSG16]
MNEKDRRRYAGLAAGILYGRGQWKSEEGAIFIGVTMDGLFFHNPDLFLIKPAISQKKTLKPYRQPVKGIAVYDLKILYLWDSQR